MHYELTLTFKDAITKTLYFRTQEEATEYVKQCQETIVDYKIQPLEGKEDE